MRLALLTVTLCSGLAAAQDAWLGPDKALHFSACAALAGVGYAGAAHFDEPPWLRLAVGATVALSAGVGKELLDLAGRGAPSWRDLAWDVAGTAVGLVSAWLLDRFVLTPLLGGPRALLWPSALAPSN